MFYDSLKFNRRTESSTLITTFISFTENSTKLTSVAPSYIISFNSYTVVFIFRSLVLLETALEHQTILVCSRTPICSRLRTHALSCHFPHLSYIILTRKQLHIIHVDITLPRNQVVGTAIKITTNLLWDFKKVTSPLFLH